MQVEVLKQYLSNKIQVVQDEGVLLALKTIIDQHLDQASNPYKGKSPNLSSTSAQPEPQKAAITDEVNQLAEELEEEKKEQEIEDWLKKL